MSGERYSLVCCLALAFGLSGCSSDSGETDAAGSTGKGRPTNSGATFGDSHEGVYHLGPVDFAETEWHNACAPSGGYRKELRESAGLSGEFLAGVSNQLAQSGGICDACILIETATGNSIVARLVTYGEEHAPGDIDVSPSVYRAINQGEDPRSMTWKFAHCPDVGGLKYEFQTASNVYWTSLWVRNPRVALAKVEVKSKNHASFSELTRGSDGTFTDAGGFGEGAFTLQVSALDGQVISEDFDGFEPGELVPSEQQFE